MQAGTKAYRAGRVDEAAYRGQVDNFFRQLGLAPAAPTPAPPLQPAAQPVEQHGAMGDDWVEKLAQLQTLHDQGVLTDEEWATAKARVLNQ